MKPLRTFRLEEYLGEWEFNARHYLTAFPHAQALLRILAEPLEQHGAQTGNAMRRNINRHYQALKAAHLHDLGLELKWKKAK